jgi:hypothetical protein
MNLVAIRLNKLMIILDILIFWITLFPNKNSFVANNSKNIHVHIMFKTLISTLKQDYEFSWVIESQNVNVPL